MCILGPVCGLLVDKFGCRKVAFAGGIITGCGLVASSFSSSLGMMTFFYGIVTGEHIITSK